MSKFPIDAPKGHVLRALGNLGFKVIRVGEHVSLARRNPDGTNTPMTIPNHAHLKSSTLRAICTQAKISREEFLEAYQAS